MGSLSLVRRLELAYKLEEHEGCVNSLHFNASGSLLASGSDDLKVVVWNWERRKKAFSFDTGHRSNVFQSKFLALAGDTHLVTASRDGQVRLAELSVTGQCRRTRRLAQHRAAVHNVALVAGNPHLVLSAGEDAAVMAIDVREAAGSAAETIVTQMSARERRIPIYSIDASPTEDSYFVTSGRDEFVRLYDRRMLTVAHPGPVKKFCPHHLVCAFNISNSF